MSRRPNLSNATRTALALFLERPGEWRYGYDMSRETGLKSGTLYPLLMRLHDQGFLEAEWRPSDKAGRPPRHAYRLTASGAALARDIRPVAAGVPRLRLETAGC
jgi:DNA-binding PadR family transcriptional regulator